MLFSSLPLEWNVMIFIKLITSKFLTKFFAVVVGV